MKQELRAECERIFREAVALDCPYLRREIEGHPEAVGYVGAQAEGDWTITVVRFQREPFPVGYDGAIRKGMTLVHMTREVAEQIWKKADAQEKP